MSDNEKKVEVVEMIDGRTLEFAGKKKLNKEAAISDDGTVTVTLDFRNGETRTFTVPDILKNQFAAHGALQKLGDEIAGLSDLDDAVMAVDALIANLEAGEWSQRKAGDGMAGTSVLARALVEMTGKPMAQIKEFLSGKTQAEKVALRTNSKIRPFIEKIEAEKAARGSKVDTDALLGELEAAE